ncbi:MAG TPA: M48 family metalloprotease [Pyrinomonadaceae bacterium]|nr:M48 family metalloprotease [Pyrinomonadaceae bacterium]
MEEKEFSALVDSLEGYAREHPGAYKLRVAMLAALGYVFLIGTVLVVLLVVGVGLYYGRLNWLVIKLLLLPLGLALIVVRSLWVKFEVPEGYELRYEDAPRLFDLAKSIREATNGPRLHKVLLTDEFNAGLAQHPRLGVFGWHENYLVVGLPLLRALSPDEVRAVISHEFGHLSGRHGVFSAWIYRVRQTWAQVLQNMRAEERFGSGIFEKFFNWYSPYFAAYSYVLARAKEYEADRTSVQLCGKENAARALVKSNLIGKALGEEFWPTFFDGAGAHPEPPKETFSEMLAALRKPIAPDKAELWLSQVLSETRSYEDTHPSPVARLEAFGYPNIRSTEDLRPFVTADDRSGDQYFLKSVPAEFVASTNRAWRENVMHAWRERYNFVIEANKGLAALEEKEKTQELTLEDRWERARFLRGTQGSAAVVPLLKEILAAAPDHANANYNLGEALLEQGDEAGIRHIEVAMEKEAHAIPAGCELIYNFLTSRKRGDEAERYRRCVSDYYREIELAQQERSNISRKDTFKHHELAPEVVRDLRDQLRTFENLGTAYLVQKVCQHFPQDPAYVLGVTCAKKWYRWHSKAHDVKLVEQLADQLTFPGFTYVIALEEGYKPLRKVFGRVERSEIYRAN